MVAGSESALVMRLLVKHWGTIAATVLPIFRNNGSALGTTANTALVKRIALPATKISQIAAGIDHKFPFNPCLHSSYKRCPAKREA